MTDVHRENQQDETESSGVTYDRVDPTTLVVSPHNERQHDTDPGEEFIDDTRRNGVEEAIEVRPTDIEDCTYEIIAGQRRWKAAQAAGLDSVPVAVTSLSDTEARRSSIRENFRKQFSKNASPGDRALAIDALWRDMGNEDGSLPSPTQIGNELDVGRTTVANWIEPLRPAWENTPIDPRHSTDVDEAIDLADVGMNELAIIRRMDATTPNKIELVRRVVTGHETQTTLRELRRQGIDIESHLNGGAPGPQGGPDGMEGDDSESYVKRTSGDGDSGRMDEAGHSQSDPYVKCTNEGGGDSGANSHDGDYYRRFKRLVEEFGEGRETRYMTEPEVIGDAVARVVEDEQRELRDQDPDQADGG